MKDVQLELLQRLSLGVDFDIDRKILQSKEELESFQKISLWKKFGLIGFVISGIPP